MRQYVQIGDRLVSDEQPCFIIAEAGVNHNGSINLAHQLVDLAARSGADAIKFQSFITEKLITPEAPKAQYQVETTGSSGSQYKMLKNLELTFQEHAELKIHCDRVGIIYMCTPYENQSVDMLDDLDVTAYKIASTDIVNFPFLKYIASKNRPVILSTGMSNLGEVEQAISTLKWGGLTNKIVILHCTSEYPTPITEVNLRAMKTMEQAFACPVGFSDHTPGIGASPWAVAIGACVVEKHFTLDRTLKGPDHRASLEPDELSALVQTIREVEAALGNGIKQPTASELKNKPLMQKSLVVLRDLSYGDIISTEDIACKRPGFGLQPFWHDRIIGKRVARDVVAETPLALADIDWNE